MKIISGPAEVEINYPVTKLCNREEILFFDIETTGLNSKYCCIYLIGCMYFNNDVLECRQYFSESVEDEKNIIEEFFKFSQRFRKIIHFNGNAFDIPFINERCKKHNLAYDFSTYEMIDLYQTIKPFKKVLNCESLSQKSIERSFGIDREDVFSGNDLIEIYREYLKNKDERLFNVLLLHNYEDVLNMGSLLSAFSIKDFFNGDFFATSAEFNKYKDINENDSFELVIRLHPKTALPCKLSFSFLDYYLYTGDDFVILSTKIIDEKIKIFYPNYEEYYYLPKEDMAVHKCVSSFVNKENRKNATPLNCYSYIQITEEMLDDLDFRQNYAINILNLIKFIK